jgi:diguanylate cyclase (GGDEF)-like protein/PAS domain S-box-containing protein
MAFSPVPANELTRLKGLRELMLLDTPAEPLFDTLAQKAAEVCQAPIALVSLIDVDRQWFKANVGLTGVQETARNVAFCAHAIMSDQMFVVPDALNDRRFAENPLVTGQPHIRFYAGCPLALPDGSKVGTLCVIDQVARQLTNEQEATLQFLSSLVTQALAMRKEMLSKALQVRTQYERALEENEERFRSLVETQTDLVSLATKDGTLHYVNPAYAKHFGLTPAEMIGRNLFEFVSENDIPLVSAQIRRVFETRESQHGENRMWGADGSEKWVAWSNHFQQDLGGQALLHSVGRDITGMRQAQQALKISERLLERTASVAKVGGWELDIQTNAVTWTLETKKIHEVDADYEPALDTAISFYPESIRPLLEGTIQEAMANGIPWDLELPLTTAKGRAIWVRACGEVEYGEPGQAVRLFGTVQDITERKTLESEFQSISREYRDLYDHAPCGYHSLDASGRFIRINQVALSWLGCRPEEVIGKLRVTDFFDDAGKARFAENFPTLLSKGQIGPVEFNLYGRQGEKRRVSVLATCVKDADGTFLMSRTVMYDVTEVSNIRKQLRKLNREQEAMLDNDMLGIAKLKDRRIIWRNRALERLFGYEPGELLGQPTAMLYASPESYEAFGQEAYPLLTSSKSFRRQWEMRRGNGDPIWMDVSGVTLEESDGETLWLLQDISEMKQYQTQVEHIAFHDNLTKLPNRLLLSDRMRQAFALNDRMNTMAAVCYLDLNGFKPVNDQYGHEVGDQLLQEVAQRLLQVVRATDTVARLGGDEFVLLLTAIQHPDEVQEVLHRAKTSIEQPWAMANGNIIRVSASFGAAFHPRDGRLPAQLLKIADDAMYEAKRSGKNDGDRGTWSPAI